MDATAARHHLEELEHERAVAANEGLLADPLYRRDLELEIEVTRQVYVGAAVTEIATLRGALFGRHEG